MDDLFSEPHQTDECAQGAGDNKAALKTICKQVLSVEAQTNRYMGHAKTLKPPFESKSVQI